MTLNIWHARLGRRDGPVRNADSLWNDNKKSKSNDEQRLSATLRDNKSDDEDKLLTT